MIGTGHKTNQICLSNRSTTSFLQHSILSCNLNRYKNTPKHVNRILVILQYVVYVFDKHFLSLYSICIQQYYLLIVTDIYNVLSKLQ